MSPFDKLFPSPWLKTNFMNATFVSYLKKFQYFSLKIIGKWPNFVSKLPQQYNDGLFVTLVFWKLVHRIPFCKNSVESTDTVKNDVTNSHGGKSDKTQISFWHFWRFCCDSRKKTRFFGTTLEFLKLWYLNSDKKPKVEIYFLTLEFYF